MNTKDYVRANKGRFNRWMEFADAMDKEYVRAGQEARRECSRKLDGLEDQYILDRDVLREEFVEIEEGAA